MKTVKAAAQVTARSPKYIAALVSVAAAVAVAVATEALLDDLVLVALALLLAVVGYLQPDWALDIMEWCGCVWPGVLFRIPVQQPQAALTIDDVPLLDKPSSLDQILDVLREHKVKATLLVMSGFDADVSEGGMQTEARAKNKALLERAVAEGHELANHMRLDRPAFAMSPEEFDSSFLHCDAFLAGLAGGERAWRERPRRWFRPASGLWNDHILAMTQKHGYTTAITNCFPHDVAAVSRHFNAQYLERRVRPGAIIVVHDRWHTPATLRKALPLIAARGLRLGTLSELQAVADAEATPEGKKDEQGQGQATPFSLPAAMDSMDVHTKSMGLGALGMLAVQGLLYSMWYVGNPLAGFGSLFAAKDDPCKCMFFNTTFAHGYAACGDGHEWAVGQHNDPNVAVHHLREAMYGEFCPAFFSRLEYDLCVNIVHDNQPDEWWGQGWCYVSSKCEKADPSNGTGSAKIRHCERGVDPHLGDKTPLELLRYSRMYDFDMGLLCKTAYPVDRVARWPLVAEYVWTQGARQTDHPAVPPAIARLKELQAKGTPHVLDSDDHHPPFGVIWGKKAFLIEADPELDWSHPSTVTTWRCLSGCE